MKLITAIIKPDRFDNVCSALAQIGITGITATEVSGFGRHKGRTEIYRGAEYAFGVRAKIKIEVAVADERLEPAVEVITHAAQTGHTGDGRVFVTALEQAIRIRTGEACSETV